MRVPSPALRPYVGSYVGYLEDEGAPGTHRGLPSPWLTLVLSFGEPIRLESGESFPAVLGGLHTEPAMIVHSGRQAGVQLGLHPLGVRALLGVPAGELSGVSIEASELLAGAAELRERLGLARGWPERFALVDRFLLRWLREDGPGVQGEVAWAWRRLWRSGGLVPVEELAADLGWSTRHLRNRFAEQVGLAPKATARVMRFDRARNELVRRVHAHAALGLADLAADFGYADQAHLAREFREFAGCSPSRWIAEEFRFVQAAGAAGQER